MTKFEEIRQAFQAYRTDWIAYRDRSYRNLGALVQGLRDYCAIPDDAFSIVPLDKEIKEGTTYGLSGAVHFDDDGFWHLGVVLRIADTNRLLLSICAREIAGKLQVKFGNDGKVQELRLEDEELCHAFYESIVEKIKEFYMVRAPEQLRPPIPLDSIGFKLSDSSGA